MTFWNPIRSVGYGLRARNDGDADALAAIYPGRCEVILEVTQRDDLNRAAQDISNRSGP